ncbi:MAG: PASTA domain-containing protein, partial [Tenericutes bacterium]|nr:PASTA domain-containing protein [Mycoplasmatota bacterium]
MTKRFIFTIIIAISAMLLVSCGGTGTTTEELMLPDLQDQNITDIETTLNDLGIDYTIQYETNPDLTEGLFI